MVVKLARHDYSLVETHGKPSSGATRYYQCSTTGVSSVKEGYLEADYPNLSTILQEGRKTKFETPDPLSTCLRVAEVAPLSPEQPTSNRKIGWMPLHVHQLLRLKKYE